MAEAAKRSIKVVAFDIATSFDLAQLKNRAETERWGKVYKYNPLIIQFTDGRYLIVFEYGSFVAFEFDENQIRQLINQLKPYDSGFNRSEFIDDFTLIIGEQHGATTEELWVKEKEFDINMVELVAIVLSRSVSLQYYEELINKSLGGLEKPEDELIKDNRSTLKDREYVKQVVQVLTINRELAYNLQLFDEPDVVWATAKLKKVYARLADLFSLKIRAQAVEHKLRFIKESNSFMLGLRQHRSGINQGWAIIGLFILETIVLIIVSLPWFHSWLGR